MNLNLLKNKFSQTLRDLTDEPRSVEDEQGELYEEVSIAELKKKILESQKEASSCREKESLATERTRLYQTQVGDITSEVAKLKNELEISSMEKASLMKTIEDLKSTIEDLEVKAISGPEDRLLFEETAKANLLLRESTIKATTEAVSLKAELKSSKEKQGYLERAIEKFQEKLEGRADELNDMNEMCASYQRQADAANAKAGLLKVKLDESNAARASLARVIEQMQEAGKVEEEEEGLTGNQTLELKNKQLREELELNKAKVIELEEMYGFMKSDKQETTNKLLEVTQKLKQKKYLETEKVNDLQQSLNQVIEERDNISRTLECTRKIVEDQRMELSSSLLRLQRQRDIVNKKELERQKSMKLYESEIDGKEELMDLMEKHIKNLEMKLEVSTVEKRSKAVNGTCDDHQQVTDLQEKVKQLEQKLLLASEANNDNKNKEKEEEEDDDDNDEKKKEVSKPEENNLACQSKDGLKKKTRQIVGNWRTKSFRYARESTKCVCCLINGKQSMGQKFAIRVGFLAIFFCLLLLGRRIMG